MNKKKYGTSVDDLTRCQRLHAEICEGPVSTYTALTHKKAFAMEIPGGSQSSRAASCLGMARGILGGIINEVTKNQVTENCVVLIKPTEVHKKAIGKLKATKDDMMNYVINKYKGQVVVLKSVKKKYKVIDNYYSKGEFEHVADSMIIAELGLERLLKT